MSTECKSRYANWEFEYSSGYPGYRCKNCGTWVYEVDTRICECNLTDQYPCDDHRLTELHYAMAALGYVNVMFDKEYEYTYVSPTEFQFHLIGNMPTNYVVPERKQNENSSIPHSQDHSLQAEIS